MGIFGDLLKVAGKAALEKGTKLVKDSFDPNSDMNVKGGLFAKKNLERRIATENKVAELEEAKFRVNMAKSRNQNFDQINQDLMELQKRNNEIDLELKRLPISEIESKTRLYEEMAKNKEAYGKILMLKKQLESLQ